MVMELNHMMTHHPTKLFVEIPEIDYVHYYPLETDPCTSTNDTLTVNVPEVFTFEDTLHQIDFENVFAHVNTTDLRYVDKYNEFEYELGYTKHNDSYSLMRFKQQSTNLRIVQNTPMKLDFSTDTCYIRFYVNLFYQGELQRAWSSSQKKYVVDRTKPIFSSTDHH